MMVTIATMIRAMPANTDPICDQRAVDTLVLQPDYSNFLIFGAGL